MRECAHIQNSLKNEAMRVYTHLPASSFKPSIKGQSLKLIGALGMFLFHASNDLKQLMCTIFVLSKDFVF